MAKKPWERDSLTPERIVQDVEECARTIGLDVAQAVKRVELVVNAFGWDWVRDSWECAQRGGFLRSKQHPLVGHIDHLERVDLYALLEIGRYLIQFCDDSRIQNVIGDLKDVSHFEDHLFALAMAYRFSRTGGQVTLEPTTDRGKADFLLAEKWGEVYAECFRQGYSGPRHQIEALGKQMVTWRWDAGSRPSVVRITLSCLAVQDLVGRIRLMVQRAREEFEVSGVATVRAERFCRISVQPLPACLAGNANKEKLKEFLGEPYTCTVTELIPDGRLLPHLKGEEFKFADARCLHIWALYLEGEVAIEHSPLTKKLRRKLSQAKHTGAARLLCVQSRPNGKPFALSAESPPVRAELQRIFDDKQDVVGVVFAERCWNERNGAGFHLQPCVNMSSIYRLPAEVWEALFRYEKDKGPFD